MKHENRPARAVKTLIAGVALSALLGFSINAQAQTCTISNWDDATNLLDGNTGTPSSSNRRYAGPCGLRVPVDGTARYLTDNSPAAESAYIARFYVFLDSAGANEVLLFADGGNNVQVWYDNGDIALTVLDSGSGSHEAVFEGVGSGWHSVELAWQASASATIAFSVNGATDAEIGPIDTSGITLTSARLGNINGANGGTIDFDDFDSRRISRPGRLCRGLTDDGRNALDLNDFFAIYNEFASGGNTLAAGQPDHNEDGVVDLNDAFAVYAAFAGGQNSCDLNS